MTSQMQLRAACHSLSAGGVVAYPTEAVWGLGCEPQNRHACTHLLHLKQRDWRKGLILIAADFEQLRPYLQPLDGRQLQPAFKTWPGPATWLVPASPLTPEWVRGEHDSVAVRVTAHPVAAALCRAYGGPIVSTSANRAGQDPAMNVAQVRLRFGMRVDAVVPGALGSLDRPTPIRDLLSGTLLRS
jgi:L-threonylcarbamoyladenylate synthase